jgi:hypothetical protein
MRTPYVILAENDILAVIPRYAEKITIPTVFFFGCGFAPGEIVTIILRRGSAHVACGPLRARRQPQIDECMVSDFSLPHRGDGNESNENECDQAFHMWLVIIKVYRKDSF